MDDPDGRKTILSEVVFTPIGGNGLVAQTVRRLMTAIETGLLELGEQLPSEAELSSSLAIAPVTLREALSILRQEGFIETRRGRSGGTFVSSPNADLRPGLAAGRVNGITVSFLQDLTDYRRAISCEAAAAAALNCSEHQLSALKSLVDAIDQPIDWKTYLRLDADFHIGIAAASASDRLLREQTAIEMETNGVVAAFTAIGIPCEPENLKRDHAELLQALFDRNSALAQDVVNRHVSEGGRILIEFWKSRSTELGLAETDAG